MKKTYKPYKAAAVIAAAVIMTSGCGQKQQEGSTMQTEEETSASGTETSSAVQRPNPMTAVTDETAFQSLGVYMALPEEAEDPLCFILNGEVAEIQFSYHEIPYSYRASNTAEDFAGIFERFTDQILTVEFKDLEGFLPRSVLPRVEAALLPGNGRIRHIRSIRHRTYRMRIFHQW